MGKFKQIAKQYTGQIYFMAEQINKRSTQECSVNNRERANCTGIIRDCLLSFWVHDINSFDQYDRLLARRCQLERENSFWDFNRSNSKVFHRSPTASFSRATWYFNYADTWELLYMFHINCGRKMIRLPQFSWRKRMILGKNGSLFGDCRCLLLLRETICR